MAEPPPLTPLSLTTPALPPHLAETANMTTDELLQMLNSTPLFMTELPTDDAPSDSSGSKDGNNVELEAFKALVHEGSPGERARDWRERGNEVIVDGRALEKQRVKSGQGSTGAKRGVQWGDAREFYSRALSALKEANSATGDTEEPVGPSERRVIEEACYINRALCNFELQNYGSCIRDCAAVLALNPRNVKALYRSAAACFTLEKLAAAHDACQRAIALDGQNVAAQSLLKRIRARAAVLEKAAQEKQERQARLSREAAALKLALRDRGILTRRTERPPEDVEDAVLKLEAPEDDKSALFVPTLLMYPLHAQTDLVKAFKETETLADHLEYILPVPWDEDGEYKNSAAVDCFMDTKDGGMLKLGKKATLGSVLGGGKVELVDGMGKIYIVPKKKVASWIEEMKIRRGKVS